MCFGYVLFAIVIFVIVLFYFMYLLNLTSTRVEHDQKKNGIYIVSKVPDGHDCVIQCQYYKKKVLRKRTLHQNLN